MGTANWFAHKPARNRGSGAPTVIGPLHASGATTTNNSSANGLDSGDTGTTTEVTLPAGLFLRIRMDEAGWLKIGGGTPAVGDGFYIPADIDVDIEVTEAGIVNVIDAA